MATTCRTTLSPTLLMLAIGMLVSATSCSAQPPETDNPGDAPHGKTDGGLSSLTLQLHELQAKVAKLESELTAKGPISGSGASSGMTAAGKGMGMSNGKGMGGGKGMMGMGGGADPQGRGMGMMMGGGMGMMGKGSMGGMMGRSPGSSSTGMAVPSALPGFPGASHLYHIGETGFFLDHPEHVALGDSQQKTLNELKERALLARNTSDRRIDEAEQELWVLTSSDSPDAAKIESKVREIEKLRGDQRLAFIRAVGEAAKVLTDEQRASLVGASAGDPANGH